MNQKRVNKVLEQMELRGMDHLLISDPSSIHYLTGYENHPGERLFVLLLSLDGKHTLFMNNLFFLDQDLGLDIVWYSDIDPYIGMIAEKLKDAKTVGVDKNWTAGFLLRLMSEDLDCAFELGSFCVDYVRMIKDEQEQELMQEASRLNDLAIDQVIDLCRGGQLTEKEITDKVLGIFQSLNCSGLSFEPIVAFGKNGADGHHVGDDSLVQPGESIVIDMGGVYKGYCSDMTRTVFYKDVSEKQKYVYNLVREANEKAEAMIKPGVRLCDIDATARNHIAKGGYTAEFNHRLGHFIGRDVQDRKSVV